MGTGPRAAARQAAALFTLAGLLAFVGIANTAGRARDLLIVATADLLVAVVTIGLPWARWRTEAAAVLAVPAFAVLGFSTWAFGGVVAGTGPFLVLIYAWAGLHFTQRTLVALIAPASAAYVAPLLATHQPPPVLGTAFVLMPVAVGVALLIEAQARSLRQDHERLVRVERWRAALIATMAHDVRSPLTTIQFALEEMRDDRRACTGELIDTTLRQVARMNRLASGLLDLDRIDAEGRLRLDVRPLPVGEVVCRAVGYLRPADISVDVDPDLVLDADPERLEQIIVNLVGNSLRHGKPPVSVEVTTHGGTARLAVRDHGPGVSEAVRTQLFARFATDASHGVGLGLWIVRQLAEAHGGGVHYEDADPGARMVVTWPVPQSGAGRAHEQAAGPGFE